MKLSNAQQFMLRDMLKGPVTHYAWLNQVSSPMRSSESGYRVSTLRVLDRQGFVQIVPPRVRDQLYELSPLGRELARELEDKWRLHVNGTHEA